MIDGTALFATLGGAVGAVGSIPYLRDVWRRSTVPHRGSWFIWSVIEVVAVEAQRADGATWSLIPLVSQAVGTCLVFALSLRLGSGGVSRVELALIALAGAGVLGWFAADEPVIATGGAILADFIGAMMMLPKAWREPQTETMSTFALASVSGVMTAGSVGVLSPPLLMYPVYFALINAVLTLVIGYRRATGSSARVHVLAAPDASSHWRHADATVVAEPPRGPACLDRERPSPVASGRQLTSRDHR
jgi:hypothetical protein